MNICERCNKEWNPPPWPRHDDPDDDTPGGVCWDCEPEGW